MKCKLNYLVFLLSFATLFFLFVYLYFLLVKNKKVTHETKELFNADIKGVLQNKNHIHHAQQRSSKCLRPLQTFRVSDEINVHVPSLKLNSTIQEVVDKHSDNFKVSPTFKKTNVLFFETLNRSDQNMKLMVNGILPHNLCSINTIYGIDLLVSKSTFASFMYKEDCVPETYLLNTKHNVDELIHHFDPQNMYILKKNIQRQQGFFISNSLHDILGKIKSDEEFVVCQRFLQDPFLISKRKINLRIYLLMVIDEVMNDDIVDSCKWYIYKNGFVYYTPELFEPHETDQKKIITSGYIDRKVYDENPMTLHELRDKIGGFKYDKMYLQIYQRIKQIKLKYNKTLAHLNKEIPSQKFSLFGCDIAPDENLDVKVMEINKGPDVSYKDERDRNVKYNLMVDAFQVVGLLNEEKKHKYENNQFVEVV